MNPTLISYLGFIVAALILIWAAVEVGNRLSRTRNQQKRDGNSWVNLDTRHMSPMDDSISDDLAEAENTSQRDLRIRAKQNGHHSDSKKLT